MDVVGVIPARFGSVRFAGKVLADILGKPMLQWVWEAAKKSHLLDDLIIACDDLRVKQIAEGFGAKAVLTSVKHTCGSDRICEVVNPLDTKVVVNIQADEPLLHPSMIDMVAEVLLNNPQLSMATLIKAIDDPQVIQDPNVVKVVIDKNNFALYFSRAAIPHQAATSDVKLPVYFKHIGIYAYTKDFLFTYKNLPVTYLERVEKLEQLRVLEHGFRIKAVETKYDTIAVDSPEDLERVKEYLAKNKSAVK